MKITIEHHQDAQIAGRVYNVKTAGPWQRDDGRYNAIAIPANGEGAHAYGTGETRDQAAADAIANATPPQPIDHEKTHDPDRLERAERMQTRL